MPSGFPILLTRLETRLALVVGGGAVAARKVEALRTARAQVRVIAPEAISSLAELAARREIEWLTRAYQPGDLKDAFLVIAATDNAEVNHAAAREAMERGCLVNVVDDPAYCNFYFPAVVHRGDLTIAISTGGDVPALSGYLRARLEDEFGPEWEDYLALLSELRGELVALYPDIDVRRRVWRRILEADLVSKLTTDGIEIVRERARELMRPK